MLYYWVKFENDSNPYRMTFKNHDAMWYDLFELIKVKGNIEWMIKS